MSLVLRLNLILTLICGREVDELDNNKLHEIIIDDQTSYLLKKSAASGENFIGLLRESEICREFLLDYFLSHKKCI